MRNVILALLAPWLLTAQTQINPNQILGGGGGTLTPPVTFSGSISSPILSLTNSSTGLGLSVSAPSAGILSTNNHATNSSIEGDNSGAGPGVYGTSGTGNGIVGIGALKGVVGTASGSGAYGGDFTSGTGATAVGVNGVSASGYGVFGDGAVGGAFRNGLQVISGPSTVNFQVTGAGALSGTHAQNVGSGDSPTFSVLTVTSCTGCGTATLVLPYTATVSNSGTLFTMNNFGTGGAFSGHAADAVAFDARNSSTSHPTVSSLNAGDGFAISGVSTSGTGVSGTGSAFGQSGVLGTGETGVTATGSQSGVVANGVSIGVIGTGTGSTGVGGEFDSGAGATAVGVRGISTNGIGVSGFGGLYAGRFIGDVTVSGNLTGTHLQNIGIADAIQVASCTGCFSIPYTGAATTASTLLRLTNSGSGPAIVGISGAATAIGGINNHATNPTIDAAQGGNGDALHGTSIGGWGVKGDGAGLGVWGDGTVTGVKGSATGTGGWGVEAASGTGAAARGVSATSASGIGVYASGGLYALQISGALYANGGTGTSSQVLIGGATPVWGAVALGGTMVSGNLPVSHLNSGTSASSSTFWRGDGTWAAAGGGSPPIVYTLNSNGDILTLTQSGIGRALYASVTSGAGITATATTGGGFLGINSSTVNAAGEFDNNSSGPGLIATSSSGNAAEFTGAVKVSTLGNTQLVFSNSGVLTGSGSLTWNGAILNANAVQVANGLTVTTGGESITNSSGYASSMFTGGGGAAGGVIYLSNSAGGISGLITGITAGSRMMNLSDSGGSCTVSFATSGFSCTSDARLKANINPGHAELATMMKLGVKQFEMIASPGVVRTGLIAQEVRNVYPDAVIENDKGYLELSYVNLIPRLIKAVQEQQDEILNLKKAVSRR